MQIATPYSKFTHTIRDVINYPCPISALPVELLQEIFAFSMTARVIPRIRANMPAAEREPPAFQTTAMILTWICSHWRHLALSMPELWGTMTINKPKKFCVDLVKVYLSRSGGSTPLNLSLHQSTVDYYTQRDNLLHQLPEHIVTVEILKLWVPLSHRWRLITLHLKCTPPSHELPAIPNGALSRVQEADINVDEVSLPSYKHDKDNVIHSLWRNIFQSPSLQIANWHNLRRSIPAAPFTQLTEFGPFILTVEELLSILPSCQQLKRFSICASPKDSDVYPSPSESPIVLPLLEDLYINAPPLLNYITSPHLRRLRISDSRDLPFDDSHSLERFLQRSCCRLQTLHLYQRYTDDETPLLEYLLPATKYLTSLEALSIERRTLSEKVISVFNPRIVDNVPSVPFPSLTYLQLVTVVAEDGIISSMLESRSTVGAPLWSFVCEVQFGGENGNGHPKDEAVISRLIQEGSQLSWFLWDEDIDNMDV